MSDRFLSKSISLHLSVKDKTTSQVHHVTTFPVVNNKIVTLMYAGSASISQQEKKSNFKFSPRPFRALWDTGAHSSVIEPRVIKELNSYPESCVTMRGIDGIAKDREEYQLLLILMKNLITPENADSDNLITLHPVSVAMLEEDNQLGGKIDILIGMDIIQRLDFAISTGVDGKVWCTIRHPASGFKIRFDGYD